MVGLSSLFFCRKFMRSVLLLWLSIATIPFCRKRIEIYMCHPYLSLSLPLSARSLIAMAMMRDSEGTGTRRQHLLPEARGLQLPYQQGKLKGTQLDLTWRKMWRWLREEYIPIGKLDEQSVRVLLNISTKRRQDYMNSRLREIISIESLDLLPIS